ncbi:MAG: hypothetical protein AB2A00_09110 [Myxococcota bacterium]
MALFEKLKAGASGNATASTSGFDRVVMRGPDGRERTLSHSEFNALPLEQRLQVLVDGRAVFYRNGQVVSAREATRK